jgi:type IV secretion system protein VirB1
LRTSGLIGMPISDMPLLWLLETCAPQIAPVTMAAIVQQESGGDWLAIHDNTADEALRPTTVEHAVSLARRLIAEGHSIDLGGAQINNANLARLGLDVGSAFEPCVNLRAAQVLLLDGWRHSGGDLPATLAIYHAGCSGACSSAKRSAGVAYSTSVYGEAGVTVPAIPDGHLASWVLPRVGAARPRATISMSPAASSLTPHGDTLSTANQAKPTR